MSFYIDKETKQVINIDHIVLIDPIDSDSPSGEAGFLLHLTDGSLVRTSLEGYTCILEKISQERDRSQAVRI